MCESNKFDYKKFSELDGIAVCEYMDPILALDEVDVSSDTIQRLKSELPVYDEIHLTYALYFGGKFGLEYFANVLPHYLGDPRGSVWAAAYNSLNYLPDEYVTGDLIESVRAVVLANPDKQWVPDALEKLEQRPRRHRP